MLTSRTEYVESTQSLALKAIKEDARAAPPRSVKRTTVVRNRAPSKA